MSVTGIVSFTLTLSMCVLQTDGGSPLHEASRYCKIDVIKLLLERGKCTVHYFQFYTCTGADSGASWGTFWDTKMHMHFECLCQINTNVQ